MEGAASTEAPSMTKTARRKKRVWRALVAIIVVVVEVGLDESCWSGLRLLLGVKKKMGIIGGFYTHPGPATSPFLPSFLQSIFLSFFHSVPPFAPSKVRSGGKVADPQWGSHPRVWAQRKKTNDQKCVYGGKSTVSAQGRIVRIEYSMQERGQVGPMNTDKIGRASCRERVL